jgi:hypothetical protein
MPVLGPREVDVLYYLCFSSQWIDTLRFSRKNDVENIDTCYLCF